MSNNIYANKNFTLGTPIGFNGTGNHSNFQTAFNPLPNIQTNGFDPKSIFSNHNFVNRNDLLNNNLDNILLNEEIREYSVMIDSKDRNYQVYPDPFCYEVKFGPMAKSINIVNGRRVIYEEPAPTINDNFTNVRYIKLDSVVLPLYTKIRLETHCGEDDDEIITCPKVDNMNLLVNNLYTVLSLGGEYSDQNYKSTNDVLSDSFAVIYYDQMINNTHFVGYTKNGIKIFPQDQLGKIDRLKINFMDPYGKPLNCNHVDKQILSCMECICQDPDGDDDTDCFIHNIHHPLNPIFQHHLHFKIGVIEPRLNKVTFN